MRILHILDHSVPLHSGYAFRTQAILRHQRALGWQTHHLTSPKHVLDAPPKETVDGTEFYRSPPVPAPWSRLPLVREFALMLVLARRLDQVIREIEPDILHVHSPVLNALPVLRAGARLDRPVLYEVRAFWEDAAISHGTARPGGARYRLSRALESFAVRRADAVTTICHGMRDDLIARGLAPGKVTVIPNGVDLQHFAGERPGDSALAESLGLSGATVLGFIGSFYAYEGLHLLIQALPRLREREATVRLLLVGGGPQEGDLKALATRLAVADKVVFAGHVAHDAVQDYYALADIMVYPRLPIRLTELVTPLKPLEAMAQHKIVVASNVGGHRELLDDGKVGRLFRPNDVDDLVAVVSRALGDRAAWPDEIRRARRFVETERTWAASVARYREVYGALLAARMGRRGQKQRGRAVRPLDPGRRA